MLDLRRSLRACVAMLTVLVCGSAMAHVDAPSQKVRIPLGKVQVVRVTSVTSILQHYTAADLEMKPADLIFAVDGVRVDSAERFTEIFEKKSVEKDVRIDFVRDGLVRQSVGPLFRFDRGVFKSDRPRWGGNLETATVDFATSLLQKPVVRNVMVLDLSYVNAGAAAGKAGLRKRDQLLSVNGSSIGSARRSDIIVPLFPEGTPLAFVYLRDGKTGHGEAPLTVVRTGLAKTLSFGFSGESRMVTLQETDLPEELAENSRPHS